MNLLALAADPDLCEHKAFRDLAKSPYISARLLASSKTMRRSALVFRLLCEQCMMPVHFRHHRLPRVVWAASHLIQLHALSSDQVAQLLTTISVLMPVVQVYNDSSVRSLQLRMRAFEDIRSAKLPQLLANVLCLPGCRGVAAERGLCSLQNCMVNIDGGGFFDTAIDLHDTPLREKLVDGLLQLHEEHCSTHLTHEVLVTCILVELCTPGTAVRVMQILLERVLTCVHQRLPIHATYVHMGLVRLLRRHDTLGILFWILNDNVLERLLVSVIVACGDVTTHDNVLIALLVIVEKVANVRFCQAWQDATLCEHVFSTLVQAAARDIDTVSPSIGAIVRVIVRTFSGAWTETALQHMLDLVLIHSNREDVMLSLLVEITTCCGRALATHRSWERVIWCVVSVANAPLTTPSNFALAVDIVQQGVRRLSRPMLLAMLQHLGFLRRAFAHSYKVLVHALHILRIVCIRLESTSSVDLRGTLHTHHIVQDLLHVAQRMLEAPHVAQSTLLTVMRTMQILTMRGIVPGLGAVYVQLDLCCVLWAHSRATMRQRQRALAIADEAVLHLGRMPHHLCAVKVNALVHAIGTGENMSKEVRQSIMLLFMHVLLASHQQCLCAMQHGSAACGIMTAACVDALQNAERIEFSMFVLCVRTLGMIFGTKVHHHVDGSLTEELRKRLLACHEHFAFHLACDAHTSQVLQTVLEAEVFCPVGV